MTVLPRQLHTHRFIPFAFVGVGVMLVGAVLLDSLVDGLHLDQNLAYAIQTIFSIEINFIANYTLTWRDRQKAFWPSWSKFHTTKIGTILLNQLLFGILTSSGIHHVISYFICAALVMVINYFSNDKYVFVAKNVLNKS